MSEISQGYSIELVLIYYYFTNQEISFTLGQWEQKV